MRTIALNLNALKENQKQWNKETFENLHIREKEAKVTGDRLVKEIQAKIRYNEALLLQQKFWRQRSKNKMAKGGR